MSDFTILQGDCLESLKIIPDDSVNLIVTSPPYSERRKDVYGGIAPDKYSEWFMPRAEEFMRVLHPQGSFILNIWEHCEKGERHTYVYELVLAMKRAGWKWIEEYIWRKLNPMPGRHRLRVRDAWEHLYHFAKTTDCVLYHDAVAVKAKWKYTKDYKWHSTKNGSGLSTGPRRVRDNGSNFGTTDSAFESDVVTPHNVIETTIGGGARFHPGTFPRDIPEFFIKLFTLPGDTVLDPFAGSGTTLFVAYNMDRYAIGCEIIPEYVEKIKMEKSMMSTRFDW